MGVVVGGEGLVQRAGGRVDHQGVAVRTVLDRRRGGQRIGTGIALRGVGEGDRDERRARRDDLPRDAVGLGRVGRGAVVGVEVRGGRVHRGEPGGAVGVDGQSRDRRVPDVVRRECRTRGAGEDRPRIGAGRRRGDQESGPGGDHDGDGGQGRGDAAAGPVAGGGHRSTVRRSRQHTTRVGRSARPRPSTRGTVEHLRYLPSSRGGRPSPRSTVDPGPRPPAPPEPAHGPPAWDGRRVARDRGPHDPGDGAPATAARPGPGLPLPAHRGGRRRHHGAGRPGRPRAPPAAWPWPWRCWPDSSPPDGATTGSTPGRDTRRRPHRQAHRGRARRRRPRCGPRRYRPGRLRAPVAPVRLAGRRRRTWWPSARPGPTTPGSRPPCSAPSPTPCRSACCPPS